MENSGDVKYRISPEFNLLYEIGMPTGRKIRNTFVMMILFLVLSVLTLTSIDKLTISNYTIVTNFQVGNFLKILTIVALIFSIVKLIVHIVFQKLQYNHITYTFYDSFMTYEDDFLNQHKKNISYKDIKEVEIRRTIWDRILDYGIIVIYTNADNHRNNGLVIYSIKDPKYHYDIIDNIIHSNVISEDNNNHDLSNDTTLEEDRMNDIKESEEEFSESLKNINK